MQTLSLTIMEEYYRDLSAILKGYTSNTTITPSFSTTTTTAAAATTTATSSTPTSSGFETSTSCNFFSLYPAQQSSQALPLPKPLETKNSIEELRHLWKPFFLKPQHSFSYSSPSPKSHHIPTKQHDINNYSHPIASTTTTPRSIRRKIQQKEVCEVRAEFFSTSDKWAWRKYGEKFIKGSLYPRGYYRCNSSRSKGCLAKKQVERNKLDPNMLIVTYIGDHCHSATTHRNSLAGSIRREPLSSQTVTAEDSSQPFTKQVALSTSGVEEDFFEGLEWIDKFYRKT